MQQNLFKRIFYLMMVIICCWLNRFLFFVLYKVVRCNFSSLFLTLSLTLFPSVFFFYYFHPSFVIMFWLMCKTAKLPTHFRHLKNNIIIQWKIMEVMELNVIAIHIMMHRLTIFGNSRNFIIQTKFTFLLPHFHVLHLLSQILNN